MKSYARNIHEWPAKHENDECFLFHTNFPCMCINSCAVGTETEEEEEEARPVQVIIIYRTKLW